MLTVLVLRAAVRAGLEGASLLREPGARQRILDRFAGRAVEHRRNGPEAELLHGPTEVGFQHLANVHAARHPDRVENNVDGGAVFEVRHVFRWQDGGDHALVAVTPGHLVACGDLAALGDGHAHELVDPGGQFVVFLT